MTVSPGSTLPTSPRFPLMRLTELEGVLAARRRKVIALRATRESASSRSASPAGPHRADRGAARPRPGLSFRRAQHAHALARRAAAPAARDPSALEPVRRRVRARRAVGRAASRPTRRRCCGARPSSRPSGNSLFVVEHELDVIRHADWIVDVGPAAGEHGGRRPLQRPARRARSDRGLADAPLSVRRPPAVRQRPPRTPRGWLRLSGVTRNNLQALDVAFPLGCFTDGDRRLGFREIESGEPSRSSSSWRRSSGTQSRRTARRGEELEREPR